MYSLKRPNLSTPVVVLFLIILYILGIDFGFKKTMKNITRLITNGVQILMIILTLFILVSPLLRARFDEKHYFFYAFYYIIHCIIMFTSKYSTCDLMIDIHLIIDGKNVSVSKKFTAITYSYFIISFLLKFSVCNIGCFMKLSQCKCLITPAYIYCMPAMVIDNLTIVQIFISYYMYLSIKFIKKSLNKIDIKILQANYMTIANCWDKIRPLYTKLVSHYFSS